MGANDKFVLWKTLCLEPLKQRNGDGKCARSKSKDLIGNSERPGKNQRRDGGAVVNGLWHVGRAMALSADVVLLIGSFCLQYSANEMFLVGGVGLVKWNAGRDANEIPLLHDAKIQGFVLRDSDHDVNETASALASEPACCASSLDH